MSPKQSLTVLDGAFAVARLAAAAPVPAWGKEGAFSSVTRTDAELSIVCGAAAVPAEVRAERDWRCLAVEGPLDFSEVGVLAALTTCLAAAGVSLFAISTYDTDYLLIQEAQLEKAVAALRSEGHSVAV